MAPDEAEREGTEAGREALIKTVADLTGVTVDHYAEIGLLGFSLITDALGGVNVCLKEPVFEPLSGADFPAGPQKLNGPQALSFVRQRHELPRGDLDRVVRQQAVMASLAHRGDLRQDTVQPGDDEPAAGGHPALGGAVRSAGTSWISSSSCRSWPAGNIAFATIPVLDEAGWSDDGMQSVVRVDPHQVQDWVGGLLQDQAKGKTEELAYYAGQNQRQRPQRHRHQRPRRSVSEVLTSKGFSTGKVGNNDAAHVSGSQVQAANADDVGAKAIAKELGGLPVIANHRYRRARLRVVLGNDYTGPGSGLATAAAAPRWRPRRTPGRTSPALPRPRRF